MITKLGISRRVETAGKNKNLFDPFKPQREEDLVIIRKLLANIHENFKEHVRTNRGDRIKVDLMMFISTALKCLFFRAPMKKIFLAANFGLVKKL